MALGDPYADLAALKSYLLGQLAGSDTVDDAELTDALNSVSREIERATTRQFNDAGTTSARLFGHDHILHDFDRGVSVAWIHDFSFTTGLIVETDDNDDGTYGTTWTEVTDFELEPHNGIVGGETGWPFYRIVPVGSKTLPSRTSRAPLRVTARWGWAAVPDPVRQAALILAAETHKLRQAPFGVAAFGEFGPIRVRDNPMARRKLAPYMLEAVSVG